MLARPDAERGHDAALRKDVVNRRAVAPCCAGLVKRIEQVDERELEQQCRHRERHDRCRVGKFRVATRARTERVDRVTPAGGKKHRPEAKLAEDDVSAVPDEEHAPVQAEHGEPACYVRQRRPEPEEQREVRNRAHQKSERRLVWP